MGNVNILVVEDCVNTGRLIEHYLHKEGYETSLVADGSKAWTHLQTNLPALIVLDEGLPGISGTELLLKIREMPGWQHIPIIFASGCTDEAFKRQLFRDGASDCLTKPFSGEELISRVNHQVGISQRQKDLIDQKTYLQAILDNTTKATIIIDEKGRVESFNLASEKMFGWAHNEIIGRNLQILIPDAAQKELEKIIQQQFSSANAKIIRRLKGCHKDGRIFPVELEGNQVCINGLSHFICVAHDVTVLVAAETKNKKHRAQLEDLVNEQRNNLQHSNSQLESFTWSASHDLQEPLRKIITFASFLQDDKTQILDNRGHYYVQRIIDTSLKMRESINAQLMYASLDDPGQQFSAVDLQQVMADVLEDLNSLVSKRDAHISYYNLPQITGKAQQMRQLFHNLLINSLIFCKEELPTKIYIKSKEWKPNWWKITVEDNGIGFESKYSEQIFSPYKRLHRKIDYPGSGMGLAICRKIAVHHGGQISAESAAGKGSTFTIRLPGKRTETGRINEYAAEHLAAVFTPETH